MRFKDRTDAGIKLAEALTAYENEAGVVYPLPRGGIVLGVEIADRLGMPIDLIIPRKIGHPHNPEYAICAVAETGDVVCNEWERRHVDPQWLEQQIQNERNEARRRRKRYLGEQAPLSVEGHIAIIVDDGIATGLTMQAAIRDAKQRKPRQLVVAIPVAPQDTADKIAEAVDAVIGLEISAHYRGAVGAYYDQFPQVSDEEVIALLGRSRTG